MDGDVPSIPKPAWDGARNTSDGSLCTTSNEQLALTDFAQRLYTVSNNELGIAGGNGNDVRKEARLLMSLSCSSPSNVVMGSGRITPPSDTSLCSSSTRQENFIFACPSLSLEDYSRDTDAKGPDEVSKAQEGPAVLLGRVLKVDDRDALRLSSEAMARNVMQSYQKAIEWRINSWIDSLSKILASKEGELIEQGETTEAQLKSLCASSEAMLIVHLREVAGNIRVLDACTDFKVLPQRVPKADGTERPTKRHRVEEESYTLDQGNGTELERSYEYNVAHLLALECSLNIHAPGAGYIQIDIQLPGSMKGTFLSPEDGQEQLTEVIIDIDTEMMASMIEKSSRMVVRSSMEALLKEPESGPDSEEGQAAQQEAPQTTSISGEGPQSTVSPKRKQVEPSVSGLVVVTPRDASSPSSFGDSDNEEKPIIFPIPDNFGQDRPETLAPQPSRPVQLESIAFASRLRMKKGPLPTVVTPSKTTHAFVEGKGIGPRLPTLVEAALQVGAK